MQTTYEVLLAKYKAAKNLFEQINPDTKVGEAEFKAQTYEYARREFADHLLVMWEVEHT